MNNNINDYVPGSAKLVKSDNTVINVADSFNSDGSLNVKQSGTNAKDKATVSISGSSAGLGQIPTGSTKAFITTETSDIRFWLNGTNPTTTQGHLVKAGGSIELETAGQLENFKAIAVSGTATLQVSYF